MFVRAELKRRAKEVLSRKYLKLFVACLLLYWLGNGIGNFKIFQINFNFSGPTAQWLDAMTITLFGKTYSGLSSLMTLFGPLVLMYTLLSAGRCGADPADRAESAELRFDELYEKGVHR